MILQQTMMALFVFAVVVLGQKSNPGLISALVIMAILVILLIVGIYAYRRQNRQGKNKLPTMSLGSFNNGQNAAGNIPSNNDQIANDNILKNMSTNRSGEQRADADDDIPTNVEEHRIIKLSNLNQHLRFLRLEQDFNLIREFQELQEVGKEMTKEIAVTEENLTKNRYKKSIHMYDSTRVKLSPIADVPGSDFINANFVSGYRGKNEFIATQGPLPTTIKEFWRMVWEQRCATIVMLTQIAEAGRVKCALYWPLKDEPDMDVGDMTLELVSEKSTTNWIHRYFKLTRGEETRYISQIHYTSWPDHGVPEVTQNVLEFVKYFQEVFEANPVQPTIVHCSAGVGRTGTFIAMDRLLQHMKDHDYVDIFGIVHEMRMCRGAMVQNHKQYIFLHKVVEDVVDKVHERKDSSSEVAIYENVQHTETIYENI
ncbi:receptor-type tyrosine-protein phosphatase beta-like [Clavelina lepadiformis]|uniref:receptor-type tyrosine-protein phosphatase beta-like n=1 Tax=Clavelina lepadiformis TaxID=159417 RepID=UPI004042B049